MATLRELKTEYDAAYQAHQDYCGWRDGPRYVAIWQREDAALKALEDGQRDYESRLSAARLAVCEASKAYREAVLNLGYVTPHAIEFLKDLLRAVDDLLLVESEGTE